jgi:hypothetical protein
MGEKLLHILCPKPLRMGFPAEIINIAKYPLAIGLLCAVGVVMITEHFAYLVHKVEVGIRVEFRFIFILTFHLLKYIIAICGKKQEKM